MTQRTPNNTADSAAPKSKLVHDPYWYKDAVVYQIHVRSFFDANDDGFGDFKGLKAKLPYLEELGVNTLWLLPFYISPLRDDGYDIADYWNILEVHGDVEDFKSFLAEAHARGMRVITEMVLNHTSDQHQWFQEARQPGSPKRDWYVWSDTSDKYQDVRIIFTDTEHSNWTWDPVAGAYYWHRFFSHQPDLNWDNPEVEKALHEVLFYWLDMGVDGVRLDAIPYLYEREGTSGENLPETLEAIKRLRAAVEARYGAGKILLAEANQWPEDTLPYFGEKDVGDGVQMAFNFPLMPRMYLALQRESRQPIVEMLNVTEDIPEDAQWALFLRNHDELTLEMVTDEERDYMYNAYAGDRQFRLNLGIRRRLAPLLGGERRRIELMNALVMSLKGSPIIYYGDEIGMGDNTFLGDRNGVRTPMQWSPDRNGGFSRAPFHQLFMPPINEGQYSYQFVNVEDAQRSRHSLYGYMQRLVRLRNQHRKTFGRGDIKILPVKNQALFAFLREYEGETLLVVANLSRFAQAGYLPLADYADRVPVELFSQAPFPTIEAESAAQYPITLSPHGFYWFKLDAQQAQLTSSLEPEEDLLPDRKLPVIKLAGGLETMLVETMLTGDAHERLEHLLPEYLNIQRWFGSKDKVIQNTELVDAVRQRTDPPCYLALVRVTFEDGSVERYFLPLTVADEAAGRQLLETTPRAAVAWLSTSQGKQLLLDATADDTFWLSFYNGLNSAWRARSLQGMYRSNKLHPDPLPSAESAKPLGVEQSNSAAVLDRVAFAKSYRKLGDTINPEIEMLRYLTAAGFPFVPQLKGTLDFTRGEQPLTLGVVQSYLEGGHDAWDYAVQEFGRYLSRIGDTPLPKSAGTDSSDEEQPAWLEETAAESLELARLLGVRTAEMHRTLAQAEDTALKPEATTAEDILGLIARVRQEAAHTVDLLEQSAHDVDAPALRAGLETLAQLQESAPAWQKIRIHGDYHLGQVMRAGSELYILDFEGEPQRTIAERRQRDQALRDVAGMLRSLEYAGLVAFAQYQAESEKDGQLAQDSGWTDLLIDSMKNGFLDAYLATAGEEASFLPTDEAQQKALLWAYQLDKVLYEIRYELGSRPDWVWLPLRGLGRLLA